LRELKGRWRILVAESDAKIVRVGRIGNNGYARIEMGAAQWRARAMVRPASRSFSMAGRLNYRKIIRQIQGSYLVHDHVGMA
jgi:hypothetical protein